MTLAHDAASAEPPRRDFIYIATGAGADGTLASGFTASFRAALGDDARHGRLADPIKPGHLRGRLAARQHAVGDLRALGLGQLPPPAAGSLNRMAMTAELSMTMVRRLSAEGLGRHKGTPWSPPLSPAGPAARTSSRIRSTLARWADFSSAALIEVGDAGARSNDRAATRLS